MAEYVTDVMFRMCEGECTAVFVAEPHDVYGRYIVCYAHVGQHSSCSWDWVAKNTVPATPDQYASLLAELEGDTYGYRLRVVKKRTAKHRKAFARQVALY
jgi:hypothetical protein